MYSLVLMAALTAGTDVAECHRSCYSGCYGGCYAGCHHVPYRSCGCYGGGYGCYGCYGSYGCYGGCNLSYGCTGAYSTWMNGHGCYGCYGCYASCSAYHPSWGVGASWGGCYMGAPIAPAMPVAPAVTEPAPEPKKEEPKEASLTPSRARVIVELPGDAKLYIDDHLMKSTSEKRTFTTPALDPSETYYYVLKAEVVRDGQPVTRTKRVILRAGDEVRAAFSEMETVSTASVR